MRNTNKRGNMFMLVIMLALVTSCATPGGQGSSLLMRTAIEIATVTMIEESEEITRNDVLSTIAEIRAKINLDGVITADEMIVAARAAIDFSMLSPYETVLLARVLSTAEARLQSYGTLVDVSAPAGEILQWIELAASLAAPEA